MTRTASQAMPAAFTASAGSYWKLFLVCLGIGFAAATAIDLVPAHSAQPEPMPYTAGLG